jgi:hypothetical protein
MSYYDHATMIAHRLGPWQQRIPEPPFDVPVRYRKRQASQRLASWAQPRRTRLGNTANGKDVATDPVIHRLRLLVLRIRGHACRSANARA